MALVSITPLSISGVQAPMNLLANLLGGSTAGTNLLYPIDLASNPTYAHSVQFTIFDYEVPKVDAAVKAVLGAAESFANNPTDALVSGAATAGNTLKNVGSSLGSILGSVSSGNFTTAGNEAVKLASGPAQLLQASTYKPVKKTSPLATISLYMPDTLNTTYNSNYTEISMTDTLGPLGFIGNAVADMANPNANKAAVAQLYGKAGVSRIAGNILGNKNMTGVLNQAFKQIPNPQMQLIYKGISLRSFQLEFIFTPTSSKEADSVDQIIKTFVYYSVPGLIGDSSQGQFLAPPQLFNIKFAFTGGSGLTETIGNVLTNTLTNVFGSQMTGLLTGSDATQKIKNAVAAKVFSVGDCVLQNVNVDYAPNGWATYDDGYPIQTRLTLQFKEMDIVTKNTVAQPRNLPKSAKTTNTQNSADISGSRTQEQSDYSKSLGDFDVF